MNTGQLLVGVGVGDHNIITGREYCAAYTDSFGHWNPGFYCPQSESKAAISCCGTATYKYCCDTTVGGSNGNGIGHAGDGGTGSVETLSTSSSSSPGAAADGAESLNVPFLVRFPILSGVVTGFLLVTIFVVIGSCYSNSCCIFSKRSYLSSGLLYQIVVRKSQARGPGSGNGSGGGGRGRRRTRPIQSMVVCTAESHLPAMPFVQDELPYGTDKSTNTSTLLNEQQQQQQQQHEPGGKLITVSTGHVNLQSSNFPISGGQSPTRQQQQQQQQQHQHQSSMLHNFQNIGEALDNSVPLPALGVAPPRGPGSSILFNRANNNDSPQSVNLNGQHAVLSYSTASGRNITGPELLLHCPSETRSRPSSQNSNGKHTHYGGGGGYARNSYSYSTLPILRGNNANSERGCGVLKNANPYYSTYEIAHSPAYVSGAISYSGRDQDYYNYGGAVNVRPYSTLHYPRPRSNPSPSQMYINGNDIGPSSHIIGGSVSGGGGSSSSTHKSILKKPGSRPLFSPSPRYYISSSSHSAPEDDDEEPDYYYMKQQISTTPPDIIQTRHSYSGNPNVSIPMLPPDRHDSPMSMSMAMNSHPHQAPQPQSQLLNYVTQQSRSVQVQLQNNKAEDQQSEVSEIEIDTFL